MAIKKKVKKVVKKVAKKTTTKKMPMKVEKPIGVVTHFYGNIKVAIVKFKQPFKVGSKLCFCGATTDFDQTVKSMQYDHKEIAVAPKGKEVGIKVGKRVREGDEVFLMD